MSDLIDRQTAIESLRDEFKRIPTTAIRAMYVVKHLPPAQPEVIRCKDCRYCDIGIDEDGNPFLKCLGWVYGGTQEEDFCSHAERRTDA